MESIIHYNGDDALCKTPQLHVDRPALTHEMRQKQFSYDAPKPLSTGEKLKKQIRKTCSFSKERVWRILVSKLPILGWLIGYDVKNWLLGDFIAGVTIAVFHIPLGMGFALLANVPAICGIYMAFYPVLIYAILSTSMHNSMGSFAVITLMTGKVVNKYATFPPADGAVGVLLSNVTEEVTEASVLGVETGYTPIQVATIVCFMVGIWQTIFGILQLGSLSIFLADMLVSGFTTAAAFHVLTSQLKDLLGLKLPPISGPLKIIYIYIEIFKAIPTVNIGALVVSIVTMTCLSLNNELLKPMVAKKTKIPVPAELLVVIIGTLTSYLAGFNENFGIKTVGDIPVGMPGPSLPPLALISEVAVDSFVIAIIAYTISYSVAKIIALKHGYVVDATQELYAQGIGNVFSSFFACPPMATALARTIIQDAVGGKTQLASLINCVFIIFVLLFIGPLFETLPKACLAGIIIVSIKGMFMQVFDMIAMWKVSRIEAIIWNVTFFSIVIIDIDFGLLIGIIFSLFVLIGKNQSPSVAKLGRFPNTDLYLDVKTYPEAEEESGLCIFRIVGSIHFANRESLKKSIVKGTGLNPEILMKKQSSHSDVTDEKRTMKTIEKDSDITPVRYLVFDMTGVSYLDSGGCKFLTRLCTEYKKCGIILCIAGLSESVYNLMDLCGCLKEFSSNHIFHSVHDAVTILNTY